MIRGILFLGTFTLFACSKKTEITKAPEELKQSIVVTNFAISSFVKQLVDDGSIIVFDRIPVGQDPMQWVPSKAMIEEIEQTKSLILVAGYQPSWVSSLSNKIKVANILSAKSEIFQAQFNPSQSMAIFKNIERELTSTFPELVISKKSNSYYNKLAYYKDKWSNLSKQFETPKNLTSKSIRPAGNSSFLDLLKKNHQLLLKERKRLAQLEGHSKTFEGMIVPILEKNCMECHDEIDEEGDVNFEPFLTKSAAELQPDLWEKVSKVIELEQMPPADHDHQLTDEDKQKMQTWISSLLEKWDSGEMGSDPGRTTVHRLNKNEYNYTIRDLFGLKIRPADNFPEQGTGGGGFDNNADALFLPPLLMENYFESVSTIVQAVYANSQTRSRYLNPQGLPTGSPEEAAKKALTYWATLIYRKPANDEEVSRLVYLFNKEFEAKKNYNEAMKMPLFSMLLSPNFLYRSTLTKFQKDPYLINDFELASKLSYFLWSSMPDKELFQLAVKGELSNPSVLESQVKRMLLDDKSKTLGMHFGGQWFGWEELRSSANPDKNKYPEFTFPLRVSLYQESMRFFNHLVKENQSAYQLLDSDYTFLNERLAKFYNIPGITGNELRLVKLQDKNRGGILGMGSVLTATSLPLRSSPSIRGAFVIKDILGITLPEPPMNIPQLPEDDREIIGKTFRETLRQHREDVNCKSCHTMIDPLGFGLEAFDAIGRFRTEQNGVPLDTIGEMPDGTSFSTPAELKSALLKQKELFVRNMIQKMLSYALGRDLTPYDRPVVKKITDKVIADDGNIQTAFIEVAKSYPFRYRRSGTANLKIEEQKAAPSTKAERRRLRKQQNK